MGMRTVDQQHLAIARTNCAHTNHGFEIVVQEYGMPYSCRMITLHSTAGRLPPAKRRILLDCRGISSNVP